MEKHVHLKKLLIVLLIVFIGSGLFFYHLSDPVKEIRQESLIKENSSTSVSDTQSPYIPGQVYDDGENKYVFKETRTMPYGIKLDVFYKQGDGPENEVGLLKDGLFESIPTGIENNLENDQSTIDMAKKYNLSMQVLNDPKQSKHAVFHMLDNKKDIFSIVKEWNTLVSYNFNEDNQENYGPWLYVYIPFIDKAHFSTAGWPLYQFGEYTSFVYPPDWTLHQPLTNTPYFTDDCQSSEEDNQIISCVIDTSKVDEKLVPPLQSSPDDVIFVVQLGGGGPYEFSENICNSLEFLPETKEQLTRKICVQDNWDRFVLYTFSTSPNVLKEFDSISKEVN